MYVANHTDADGVATRVEIDAEYRRYVGGVLQERRTPTAAEAVVVDEATVFDKQVGAINRLDGAIGWLESKALDAQGVYDGWVGLTAGQKDARVRALFGDLAIMFDRMAALLTVTRS